MLLIFIFVTNVLSYWPSYPFNISICKRIFIDCIYIIIFSILKLQIIARMVFVYIYWMKDIFNIYRLLDLLQAIT